jgi:hypothetical protein
MGVSGQLHVSAALPRDINRAIDICNVRCTEQYNTYAVFSALVRKSYDFWDMWMRAIAPELSYYTRFIPVYCSSGSTWSEEEKGVYLTIVSVDKIMLH